MATYRVTIKDGLSEARIEKSELFRILIPTGIDPNIITSVDYDSSTEELVFTFPRNTQVITVPLTDTDPPPIGP